MERSHIRGVNQETPNAPSPMLPPSGRGNANQVPLGQGQRVDGNTAMDPKKLKRVSASREYSQRYRLKQLQYIAQLEAGVRALQAEVAMTVPRIQYADAHNSLLRAENGAMKEKLSALSAKLMFKQAEYHELKTEKEVLKHISLMQQQQQQSSPFGQTSNQTRNYSNQMVNMANMDQSGFNQFVGTAARPPMMQNQDLENEFAYNNLNNRDGDGEGDNRNPM